MSLTCNSLKFSLQLLKNFNLQFECVEFWGLHIFFFFTATSLYAKGFCRKLRSEDVESRG